MDAVFCWMTLAPWKTLEALEVSDSISAYLLQNTPQSEIRPWPEPPYKAPFSVHIPKLGVGVYNKNYPGIHVYRSSSN